MLLNTERRRTRTRNDIPGRLGVRIHGTGSGRLHCRLQLIYRFESRRGENAGNQIIKALFLHKPCAAKRVAKLPVLLTGPVNQVRQAMTKTIKIGCVCDPGRVRQMLINRRGPFIETASHIANGPACFNIIHGHAKRAGQRDPGLLQLSGPSQQGRQRRDVCCAIDRL